eukprot:g3081.t1
MMRVLAQYKRLRKQDIQYLRQNARRVRYFRSFSSGVNSNDRFDPGIERHEDIMEGKRKAEENRKRAARSLGGGRHKRGRRGNNKNGNDEGMGTFDVLFLSSIFALIGGIGFSLWRMNKSNKNRDQHMEALKNGIDHSLLQTSSKISETNDDHESTTISSPSSSSTPTPVGLSRTEWIEISERNAFSAEKFYQLWQYFQKSGRTRLTAKQFERFLYHANAKDMIQDDTIPICGDQDDFSALSAEAQAMIDSMRKAQIDSTRGKLSPRTRATAPTFEVPPLFNYHHLNRLLEQLTTTQQQKTASGVIHNKSNHSHGHGVEKTNSENTNDTSFSMPSTLAFTALLGAVREQTATSNVYGESHNGNGAMSSSSGEGLSSGEIFLPENDYISKRVQLLFHIFDSASSNASSNASNSACNSASSNASNNASNSASNKASNSASNNASNSATSLSSSSDRSLSSSQASLQTTIPLENLPEILSYCTQCAYIPLHNRQLLTHNWPSEDFVTSPPEDLILQAIKTIMKDETDKLDKAISQWIRAEQKKEANRAGGETLDYLHAEQKWTEVEKHLPNYVAWKTIVVLGCPDVKIPILKSATVLRKANDNQTFSILPSFSTLPTLPESIRPYVPPWLLELMEGVRLRDTGRHELLLKVIDTNNEEDIIGKEKGGEKERNPFLIQAVCTKPPTFVEWISGSNKGGCHRRPQGAAVHRRPQRTAVHHDGSANEDKISSTGEQVSSSSNAQSLGHLDHEKARVHINLEQFNRILTSSSICIWGECHRSISGRGQLLSSSGSTDSQKSHSQSSSTLQTNDGENKEKSLQHIKREFIPSKTFNGAKDGFVYQNGDQGLGYYTDFQTFYQKL